jgi:hypothetical protein
VVNASPVASPEANTFGIAVLENSNRFFSNADSFQKRACAQPYTVVAGDTCAVIESKTGVSDALLHSLNPAINSGCTSMLPFHISMSVALKCFLPLDLQIGQALCLSGGTSSGCSQTYTVVSGDTCSAIESKTGVSDAQLHAQNPAINSACTSAIPCHLSMSIRAQCFC